VTKHKPSKGLFKELSVKTLNASRCEVSPFTKFIVILEINIIGVLKDVKKQKMLRGNVCKNIFKNYW
jgi:hypothetical protein